MLRCLAKKQGLTNIFKMMGEDFELIPVYVGSLLDEFMDLLQMN